MGAGHAAGLAVRLYRMLKQTLATVVLASSLTACHDRVIAVSPPAEPGKPGQMAVTGTATLEVSPDCADLTMTLSADGARPGAATSAVDAKERAVVAALGKLGVESADLKLSLVSLEPIYEENRDHTWSQLKIQTYRAQITVTATTHDFAKIGSIMEAGADAGASSLTSQFRRSDLPELKQKVRAMALAAAKDKAKQTADALGIKLGRVVSVAENVGGYMWNQQYFPQAAANMAAVSGGGGGAAIGGTLQPLTLDVSIGYELAREV